ncbi:hypothetical protein V1511DRAFT_502962 [Dipodascopsis uninucleata]
MRGDVFIPVFLIVILRVVLALNQSYDTAKDLICVEGSKSCYPKVFEPDYEWKAILPGQEIPPGLHVRMNFENGKREAKILSNSEISNNTQISIVKSEATTVEDSGIDQHHDEPEYYHEQATFSISDSNGDDIFVSHKPNPHITLDEQEEFKSTLSYVLNALTNRIKERVNNDDAESEVLKPMLAELNILGEEATDLEILLEGLRNLEDFSHEIDFGLRLAHPDILPVLLTSVKDDASEAVRSLCSRIIGSSLRNNIPALQLAIPSQAVLNLLDAFKNENDSYVRGRILFALASSIHGKYGRKEYVNSKGGQILREHFESDPLDEDFLGRCGTFVEDSFVNDMMTSSESRMEQLSDAAEHELQSEMGLWCSSFQDALASDSITRVDVRDKIFSALSAIKVKYAKYCPVKDSFRNWMADKINERNSWLEKLDKNSIEEKNSVLKIATAEITDIENDRIFLDKLAQARHVLFGNPKAARKAFSDHDEL